MSITTGSTSIQLISIPQFYTEPFEIVSGPSIFPTPPATSHREGGGYTLGHGVYGPEIKTYYQILYRYSSAGALISAIPYTVAADAPLVTGTYPTGAAGNLFLLGEVAEDIGGRKSPEILSSSVVVLLNTQAPQCIVTPGVTTPANATTVGTVATCDKGTWTGVPDPNPTLQLQWYKDNVAIPGATTTTYTFVVSDTSHNIMCRVTPQGYPALAVDSNIIIPTPVGVTWPGYISPANIDVIETSTSTVIGTRQMRYGTSKPGGAAITWNTALFDLVRAATIVPIEDFASNAPQLSNTGSGTVNLPNELALGTIVYHSVAWQLIADRTQWKYAIDQSVKTNIDGVDYPPLTVKIVGQEVTPPVTLDTITAMGDPIQDFINVAKAAGNVGGGAKNGFAMQGTNYACSLTALGVAALKGHADARTNLVGKVQWFINTGSKNPYCCGAFTDNTSSLCAAAVALLSKDSAGWGALTAKQRANLDLMMTVCAVEGAFTASDANPNYTGSGKVGNITASGMADLKVANPNLSLQAICMCYISMAYFGGPNEWLAKLDEVRRFVSNSDNGLKDLRDALNNPETNELYRTMTWATSATSTQSGARGGPKNSAEQDVPTDAQLRATLNNPKYFGRAIATSINYSLPMITSQAEGKVPTWIESNIYKGWQNVGVKAGGAPKGTSLATSQTGMTQNLSKALPYEGDFGAPYEMIDATDEGARSAMHYTLEGGVPIMAAWVCLWVAGLIDPTDPKVQISIYHMHRCYTFLRDYVDRWGWYCCEHKKESPDWPSSSDYQRHLFGAVDSNGNSTFSDKAQQGGNLFEIWHQVLGPALGCGQIIKNGGFANTNFWTGFGTGGKSASGGVAIFSSVTSGVANGIKQSVPLLFGRWYQVQYTVSNRTAGDIVAAFIGGVQKTGTTQNANGTYTQRIQAVQDNNSLALYSPSGSASLSLDNVSVTGPFKTSTLNGE